MPPINIRMSLFKRTVKYDMDLITILNDHVEKLLDEKDREG